MIWIFIHCSQTIDMTHQRKACTAQRHSSGPCQTGRDWQSPGQSHCCSLPRSHSPARPLLENCTRRWWPCSTSAEGWSGNLDTNRITITYSFTCNLSRVWSSTLTQLKKKKCMLSVQCQCYRNKRIAWKWPHRSLERRAKDMCASAGQHVCICRSTET